MTDYLSIHDKWAIVQNYYETSYKIKFKKKPKDAQIEELFKNMEKLSQSVKDHFFEKPGAKKRFFKSSGLEPA